jgi:hypothetical protein
MTDVSFVFIAIVVFCLGIILSLHHELRQRKATCWRTHISDLQAHIRWLEFAAGRAERITKQGKGVPPEAIAVLADVFDDTKYYLGKTKDSLLTELGLDVEAFKKEVNSMKGRQRRLLATQDRKQKEQIEVAISSFCEAHAHSNLPEFIKSNWMESLLSINNTLDYLQNSLSRCPISMTSFFLSVLPMVISFVAALLWIVKLAK